MSDSEENRQESSESEAKKPAEKPVSLYPLGFKEAVRDLFKVKAKQDND